MIGTIPICVLSPGGAPTGGAIILVGDDLTGDGVCEVQLAAGPIPTGWVAIHDTGTSLDGSTWFVYAPGERPNSFWLEDLTTGSPLAFVGDASSGTWVVDAARRPTLMGGTWYDNVTLELQFDMFVNAVDATGFTTNSTTFGVQTPTGLTAGGTLITITFSSPAIAYGDTATVSYDGSGSVVENYSGVGTAFPAFGVSTVNGLVFDPNSIANLLLDLQPAGGCLNNSGSPATIGDAVKQFDNRPGLTPYSLTQLTLAQQPTLQFDGEYFLQFDGVNDCLSGAGIISAAQDGTVAIVVDTADPSHLFGMLWSLGSSAAAGEAGWAVGIGDTDADAGAAVTKLVALFGAVRWIRPGCLYTSSGRHVLVCRVDSILTTGANTKLDSPNDAKADSGGPYATPKNMTVLGAQKDNGFRPCPASLHVKRVCYWTRSLTDGEIATVVGGL